MRSSSASALIALIRLYQRVLSPVLSRHGVRCRFYPSCSEYGILAITKYGPLAGLRKTAGRIMRCRPDNVESCIDYP